MNRFRLACLLAACMIASPANAAVSNPNCDWKDVATASNCTIVDMRDNGLRADLSDEGALALAWYGLAANAGDAIGEHHMAIAYFKGEGIKQDYDEALRLWLQAANRGLTIAQINVALRYIHGQGTNKDYVQAYKWLTIASKLRDESADRILKDFADQLTPDARKRATQMAESWTAENNDFPLLKREFPSMIESEWDMDHTISFCPDNTCETLVFSRHEPRQFAEDYALIYLFSVSEYWLLDDWRKQPGVSELVANAVRAVPTEKCHEEDLMASSRCIIRQMNRSKRLRVHSLRYDEGAKVASKKNELDHMK